VLAVWCCDLTGNLTSGAEERPAAAEVLLNGAHGEAQQGLIASASLQEHEHQL